MAGLHTDHASRFDPDCPGCNREDKTVTTNTRLNELTDKLNEEIIRAETALRALQLGVTAAIPLDTPGGPSMRWPGFSLAFGKDERAWRLLVVKPNGEPILLVRTSREMRLDAVQRLPSLLRALESQTKSEETEVEMAIERTRDFTEKTRAKGIAKGGG